MDWFERYDELPIEVKSILDKYSEMDNNYENCENLSNELFNVKWTIEYGLSAEPYNLRPITKIKYLHK